MNGAGIECMQAKREEMFGSKEAEGSETKEKAKVKKPRWKAAVKVNVEGDEKHIAKKTKAVEKKRTLKKNTSDTKE